MKKIIGCTLLAVVISSGSWAFGYQECLQHSRIYCKKNNCKVPPKKWCNEIDNIKKAKKHYEENQTQNPQAKILLKR